MVRCSNFEKICKLYYTNRLRVREVQCLRRVRGLRQTSYQHKWPTCQHRDSAEERSPILFGCNVNSEQLPSISRRIFVQEPSRSIVNEKKRTSPSIRVNVLAKRLYRCTKSVLTGASHQSRRRRKSIDGQPIGSVPSIYCGGSVDRVWLVHATT